MKTILIVSVMMCISLHGIAQVKTSISPQIQNSSPEWGNTNASLQMGGRVAYQDGWLFYANPYDEFKLYKIKIDGKGKTKLCEDMPSYINVIGEKIFYLNWNNQTKEGFYRIQTDGKLRTLIDESMYGYLRVNKSGWAYFLENSQVFQLPTHKVTVSKEKMFDDDEITTMAIDNGYVYYTKWWEKISINPQFGGLYVYHREQKEIERLVHFNHQIRNFTISEKDRWVYFMQTGGYTPNVRDGSKQYKTGLFRITEDSKEPKSILVGDDWNWTLIGDWVYFYKDLGNNRKELYRKKPDGTLEQRISNLYGNVYEAGDYIVVWTQKEESTNSQNSMFIMLKDGRYVKELK